MSEPQIATAMNRHHKVPTANSMQEVERTLNELSDIKVETFGKFCHGDREYSLLACLVRTRRSLPNVVISAGVHGDEVAGVFATLEFLQSHVHGFSDIFNFLVFPCLNPSGFEAKTLETSDGINLNRSFGINSKQAEIASTEAYLEQLNLQFRVAFDLHETVPNYVGEGFNEDDNPRSCFLYETTELRIEPVGRAILDSLPTSVEICDWDEIYLDKAVAGLVHYPLACKNPIYAQKTSFDAFLNGRYTHHSFTTETPTSWELRKRIDTQLRMVCSGLELISGAN